VVTILRRRMGARDRLSVGPDLFGAAILTCRYGQSAGGSPVSVGSLSAAQLTLFRWSLRQPPSHWPAAEMMCQQIPEREGQACRSTYLWSGNWTDWKVFLASVFVSRAVRSWLVSSRKTLRYRDVVRLADIRPCQCLAKGGMLTLPTQGSQQTGCSPGVGGRMTHSRGGTRFNDSLVGIGSCCKSW
jgi:hypothetical protein